jgi:hypothetical protein
LNPTYQGSHGDVVELLNKMEKLVHLPTSLAPPFLDFSSLLLSARERELLSL